jgi:hypothetical protein
VQEAEAAKTASTTCCAQLVQPEPQCKAPCRTRSPPSGESLVRPRQSTSSRLHRRTSCWPRRTQSSVRNASTLRKTKAYRDFRIRFDHNSINLHENVTVRQTGPSAFAVGQIGDSIVAIGINGEFKSQISANYRVLLQRRKTLARLRKERAHTTTQSRNVHFASAVVGTFESTGAV